MRWTSHSNNSGKEPKMFGTKKDTTTAVPRRGRTATKLVAALSGFGLLASACVSTQDVDLNMETLTVVTAQEDGFFSDGDEPYVAVIEWRAVPGEPGSTRTQYKGNLAELSTGAFDGEILSIPASMGSSDFNNLQFVDNISDVVNGTNPELVGTVMIAMESDATPWSLVDNVMLDVQSALHTEVENIVEPLTLAELANPTALANELADASDRVQDAATPSIGEALGIWFASLGDPDDFIGVNFEVWVAAKGALADQIDIPLQNALASAGAVGGALRDNETRQVTFSGDDAVYRVNLRTAYE